MSERLCDMKLVPDAPPAPPVRCRWCGSEQHAPDWCASEILHKEATTREQRALLEEFRHIEMLAMRVDRMVRDMPNAIWIAEKLGKKL
jgi:hypothetical protein